MYGYMTPLKVKIIIALELSDTVVKDADVITVRAHSVFQDRSFIRPPDLPGVAHCIPPVGRKSVLTPQSPDR